MYEKYNVEERCRKILEDNGGFIADKARTILLEDPALKDLRHPLEFISKNWRDLTPALMSLSCEAVGGRPEETYDSALAMCLMHLSFYVWDDIMDNARSKSFKPTLFGKFGAGTSLIIGGLASAKAFLILNEMNMKKKKRQTITNLVWELWTTMARAETVTLRLQSQKIPSHRKKFLKIKTEAKDTETCLRIGAVVGNGSESEINHLGKYGLCLGIIVKLWNDFRVSANLTLELAEKIRSGKLPYSLMWARDQSETLQKKLDALIGKNTIEQTQIKDIVQETLATKALEYTARNVKKYMKKAKKELTYLKKNSASQTLESFVGFQPRLFMESLSLSQAQDG
jgi:geranylgeranyl pyrophosphate synthase